MTGGVGFVTQKSAGCGACVDYVESVMATPGLKPIVKEDEDIGAGSGEGHRVFLFNCNCHTFEQVITQLCKAIQGMTESEAEAIAWRVHNEGLAEVYKGGQSECEKVARIIGEIGLIVQVH